MDENQAPEVTESKTPSEIRFHFLKSNLYRNIHVDGAFGGMTPQGLFSMQLYSERFPVPRAITHAIENGQPGKELGRDSRDGIVRELEIGATFSLQTAKSIRDWLIRHIDVLEKQLPEADKP